MKAITVKQPWASLIVECIKDVENRTWKTNFRGRVLVHAAAKYDDNHREISRLLTPQQYNSLDDNLQNRIAGGSFPLGSIIGSVEIVDCVINHPSIWAEKTDIPNLGDVLDDLKLLGKVIPPHPITYNWVLANPIKFPEPIPCKGKLSFWDYPNIISEPEEEDGSLFCHCQICR